MKVVADDKIPFLKGVLEPFVDVVYKKGADISKEDLEDAQGLITRTRTKCNEKLLKDTAVEIIVTATIGYDHIDTGYCEKNGVAWTNAPGCNSGSVYQYIGSVLSTLAQKYKLDFSTQALGVIGVGNVGKKVVRLGELMGAQVYLNDPPRQHKEGSCGFVSLDGIVRECNIITIHVPLTKEGPDKTYHLVDENFLKRLNPDTILINSSRGEVVDKEALKKALKEKWIRAAVLDVWENEPNIDLELLQMLDIATPHIAGYSVDGKANGTAMSVQALSRKFDLPLRGWRPEDLPLPSNALVNIDCSNKTEQQVIIEAILSTYRVLEDDARLRKSVETFEAQRGSYPNRREFHAFSVKLDNKHGAIEKRLKGLGFNII
jgi:erythronate-4-phosphate dehydrogenase